MKYCAFMWIKTTYLRSVIPAQSTPIYVKSSFSSLPFHLIVVLIMHVFDEDFFIFLDSNFSIILYQFQELKEEIEDDEAMDDSNQESEANDSSHSPFKRPSDAQSIDGRPSDAQSIDGSSKGGRERHLSHTSMESEAESSIGNFKLWHIP